MHVLGFIHWAISTDYIPEKALKALVLQKACGRNLTASIDALKIRSEDLRRAATACHQSVNVQSNLLSREIKQTTRDTQTAVGQISKQGGVLVDEFHELREEVRDVRDIGKAIMARDAQNGQLEVLVAAVKQSMCEYQYIGWKWVSLRLTTFQG